MFADLELIGIPYRVTVGDRGLKEGKVEMVSRHGGETREVALTEIVSHIQSIL